MDAVEQQTIQLNVVYKESLAFIACLDSTDPCFISIADEGTEVVGEVFVLSLERENPHEPRLRTLKWTGEFVEGSPLRRKYRKEVTGRLHLYRVCKGGRIKSPEDPDWNDKERDWDFIRGEITVHPRT